MSTATEPKLYFKHLYTANPQDWGAFGFPNSQNPENALRGYEPTDLVLLAITKSPRLYPELSPELHGKIFAICTLISIDGPTETVANPEMVRQYPDIVEQWRVATPINEFWQLRQAKAYDDFCAGALTELATVRRGQLINLTEYPEIEAKVRLWLGTVCRDPVVVYHSLRAKEVIAIRGH